MKAGETWRLRESSLKTLFNMGASPIAVGSGKVKIVAIHDNAIEYRKFDKEYTNTHPKETFIKLYEKVYE